jgi:hypothetical protein
MPRPEILRWLHCVREQEKQISRKKVVRETAKKKKNLSHPFSLCYCHTKSYKSVNQRNEAGVRSVPRGEGHSDKIVTRRARAWVPWRLRSRAQCCSEPSTQIHGVHSLLLLVLELVCLLL